MNNIPVGPHTKQLMDKIVAEGNQSEEYTHSEKMALVADGLMDPKEVGLTSAEEAHLEIMPEAKPKPEFGDALMLQAGVVPIELRAQWAYSETKIILAPADKTAWIQNWIELNSRTYKIQGALRTGNLEAKFERTFSDPILGQAEMLRLAADQLEAAYLGKPCQPTTDETRQINAPAPQPQIEDAKNETTEPKE